MAPPKNQSESPLDAIAAAKAEAAAAEQAIEKAQAEAERTISEARQRKAAAEARARDLAIADIHERLDPLLARIVPEHVFSEMENLVEEHAQQRRACAESYRQARDYRATIVPIVTEAKELQRRLRDLGELAPERDPGAILHEIMPHFVDATRERSQADMTGPDASDAVHFAFEPDAVVTRGSEVDNLLDRMSHRTASDHT